MSDHQIKVPRHVVSSIRRTLDLARDRAARANSKVAQLEDTLSRLVVTERHSDSDETLEAGRDKEQEGARDQDEAAE